jgi:transcriptional antiterminator NusG
MGEIVKKWYVVRAVSGKEKKVKEYLELEITRMKLDDYVNQVLIPTEKVFKIQNGKSVIFASCEACSNRTRRMLARN